MLAITVCATSSYCHSLKSLLRSLSANLHECSEEKGTLILTGDDSAEFRAGCQSAREFLPEGWAVTTLKAAPDKAKNYETEAQLTIAALRSAAFSEARRIGATECWSLDSDVLPPPNALRVMRDALSFDQGYYAVATCPYPSAGGGGFLFGRGIPQRQICEDVSEEEREIPEELALELKTHREASEKDQAWQEKAKELEKKIKECQPKGNVFALNAKQWRKRGWGDMAYPAIGRGSMVPTDWCGFGCTLMNKEALARADFVGYEGRGTEDLFVVWNKWYPAGLKIAALPHVVCHHVIRNTKEPKTTPFILAWAGHETEGEAVGHLRVRHQPWLGD